MSHFSVLITLPAGTPLDSLEDEIGKRMDRWDENREVKPYRDYVNDTAAGFWWVESVMQGAEHHRNGTGILPYDRDGSTWYSSGSPYTEDEQRARFAANADFAARIGDVLAWETVVPLYNEAFGHGRELAGHADGSPSETLFHEVETDRAYTMSTRNPEGFWDYWRIGGRWGNGYFLAKGPGAGLIQSVNSWDSPKEALPGVWADGGPRGLLDLDGMREQADAAAGGLFTRWQPLIAQWPDSKPWAHFTGLVDAGELTIAEARDRYHEQPILKAAEKVGLYDGWGSPIEEFNTTREEYCLRARRSAVPGYALITLDGEWIAPGRMGWFGMSSDGDGEREGYQIAVNRYLDDKLGDDDLVVVLDCHV
jgi:hypothetical protein